jgi:hypothetical protein
LALLVEPVAEAIHFDVRPGINAFDCVLNPTPLHIRDEFFIGQAL